jgi:hypothetical protein
MKARLYQSWRFILAVGGLVLLTWLVIGFNSRMAEMRRLSVGAEQVGAEYQALLLTEAALDESIAFASSDAAVEKWAYEEAHWIRKGDRLIGVISADSEQPVESPAVEEQPTHFENWQVWLALFFD